MILLDRFGIGDAPFRYIRSRGTERIARLEQELLK